jgi:hypothetical protein
LPTSALPGGNAVIPIQLTGKSGSVSSTGLSVFVVYQMLDASGATLGAPQSAAVPFTRGSNNNLVGDAIIPVSDVSRIPPGGSLQYLFFAQQGASGTLRDGKGQSAAPALSAIVSKNLNNNGFSPFQTTITNPFCRAIDSSGARVGSSGLSATDGKTAVALAPGTVPSPGTLCIQVNDPSLWPSGPHGAKAAAVYTITLQNTTLASPAQLVLNYPSDPAGKVLGSGADPTLLGIYWLDNTNGAFPTGDWRPLSQASVDTTLHTVTGTTGHFSTFGLFLAGTIGTSDLRPVERIITPNGDGVNDVAHFGAGIDEIHIFDVRGRRVRTIPGAVAQWDGTDDNGKVVESGVYIYQYTSQGDRVSGVIGVAK